MTTTQFVTNKDMSEDEQSHIKNNIFEKLNTQKEFREESRLIGVPALQRLGEVAKGNTGQSYIVRKFLLGCYNGTDYPFNLNDLRSLDLPIYKDCILVLNMDRTPKHEVHEYFENGSQLFQSWI